MEEQSRSSSQTTSLEKLVQRWRDKVYECLLANKRNEITIKENMRQHKKETAAIETMLKQSQAEVHVLKMKLSQHELE